MLRLHPLPTVIPFFFTSLGGACYKTVKVLVAQLCLTLCDPMDYIACQASLSVELSRQEHWIGLPFPSPMHASEK